MFLPPFCPSFTDWLSMITKLCLVSRPSLVRTFAPNGVNSLPNPQANPQSEVPIHCLPCWKITVRHAIWCHYPLGRNGVQHVQRYFSSSQQVSPAAIGSTCCHSSSVWRRSKADSYTEATFRAWSAHCWLNQLLLHIHLQTVSNGSHKSTAWLPVWPIVLFRLLVQQNIINVGK